MHTGCRQWVLFLSCLSLGVVGCGDRILGPRGGDGEEIPSTGGPAVRVTYPYTPPDTAAWTVMLYMSGDNDLESYIVLDMENELAVTGSSADVQVVALADRHPRHDDSRGDWDDTKLFHVTRGMQATADNAVMSWGECNMGEPEVLRDFILWSKANYPARRYALYFWGHGWSWRPGWVLEDFTNNGALDMDEIASILPDIGTVDMVGFDCCNMSAIEVYYLWRDNASAASGSQEYVGMDAVDYDLCISSLTGAPSMTAEQLAVVTSQGTVNEYTWSAITLDNRFDNLITVLDAWSGALLDGLSSHRSAYQTAFRATQSFVDAPMDKDLYDMAYELRRSVADDAVDSLSLALMSAVDAAVLHEHHTSEYSGAHGVTIYHPESGTPSDDDDLVYYQTLDLSADTRWDEFVTAWIQ